MGKPISDQDLTRIDSDPQDKPGQIYDDLSTGKSWMYVQNAGVDLAVVDEVAARHTDGVAGHASGTVATSMVDSVNSAAICLGVWEAAVPGGSYGYVQKTGDRASVAGTIPAVGLPIYVADGTFVMIVQAALVNEPFQGYSLDGTAVHLRF